MAKKIEKKDAPVDHVPPSEAILESEGTGAPEAGTEATSDAPPDASGTPQDNSNSILADAQRKRAASAYAQTAEHTPTDAEAIPVSPDTPDATPQPAPDTAPAGSADYYKTVAQRTAAEFDNYRKRIKREQATWRRDILGAFLQDFLPAFDDLNRALAEGEKTTDYDVIHNGVALVRTNLWKTMEKAGVKEIEAKGMPFNPAYHEAMTAVPMPDVAPNTVIDVYQPGYMIDDFVLRPAQVVVSAPV